MASLTANNVAMVLFRPIGPEISELEFKDRLDVICNDLHRLLCLDTKEFWNMIVVDRSIIKSIDSFLKFSPRHWFEFDQYFSMDGVKKALETANRLYFLVLLRMATNKETTTSTERKKTSSSSTTASSDIFMPTNEFGKMIYDKKIWTVPMFFDVVALYGASNGNILMKMLESLFTCQPKFAEDLTAALENTEQALRQLAVQLEQIGLKREHDNERLMSQLSDMLLFSYDTFFTLEQFFKTCPFAIEQMSEQMVAFLTYFADFSDSTLQVINHHLKALPTISEVELLKKISTVTEVKICNAFHHALVDLCIRPPKRVNAELCFSILTTIAGHPRFVWLLDELHPFSVDFSLLEKYCGHNQIDKSSKDYVATALKAAKETYKQPEVKKETKWSDEPKTNRQKVASGGPSRKERDEMINMVIGVMGQEDMDKKFLDRCLKRYDFNVENLVQALLDNNLPPDLHQEKEDEENTEYTSENIEAALSSVHIGKRETVLEQKEITDMKSRYAKYANQVVEVDTTKVDGCGAKTDLPSSWVSMSVPELEYDDEYDDTYDDNAMAVGPQGDDVLKRRDFTIPRVFQQGGARKPGKWEEEETEETEEDGEMTGEGELSNVSGNATAPSAGASAERWDNSGNVQAGSVQMANKANSGDTRGFKGAGRYRAKIEKVKQKDKEKPQSAPAVAKPLAEYTAAASEAKPHRPEITDDNKRQKKERHKGSVGNHNRRDQAARKRREF